MRTPFTLFLVLLLGTIVSAAEPPRVPRTNDVVRYERDYPVFQSKTISRERGDALLSALDGGRQLQEPQYSPGMIVDPAPAHYWLSLILTNGSVYRIGIALHGCPIYLPDGLYEANEVANKKIVSVINQLDGDLRQEIVNAPKPVVYKVGTVDDGGTLSGIARLFYGDASKWRQIYEANRSVLKNPNAISGSEKLTIPRLK